MREGRHPGTAGGPWGAVGRTGAPRTNGLRKKETQKVVQMRRDVWFGASGLGGGGAVVPGEREPFQFLPLRISAASAERQPLLSLQTVGL